MEESVYYVPPITISEKFTELFMDNIKKRKLGRTVKDREISVAGYLMKPKELESYRLRIWKNFSVKYGDFSLYYIAPLPFASVIRYPNLRGIGLPVAIIKSLFSTVPRGTVELKGLLFDFSEFSYEIGGRFIIATDIKKIKVQEYLSIVKPIIDGKKAMEIIRSSFDEDFIKVFIPKFVPPPSIYGRVGGVMVGFGIPPVSKSYGIKKEEYKLLRKSVPVYLKSGDSIRIKYNELSIRMPSKHSFKVGYLFSSPEKYEKFGIERKDKDKYERSETTQTFLRHQKKILILSDLPFMPLISEARVVDGDYFREYAFDIAHYSLHKYFQEPEINPLEFENAVDKIMEKIKEEFPDIYTLMGVDEKTIQEEGLKTPVMIMGEEGCFGEHLRRALYTLSRNVEISNPIEYYWNYYLSDFLSRYCDEYREDIRYEANIIRRRQYKDRRLIKMLKDLNNLYSNGWYEDTFVRKAIEYGVEDDENKAHKLFNELYTKGIIIEKSLGMYWAIGEPSEKF